MGDEFVANNKLKVLCIINGTYIHSTRWIDSLYEKGYELKVFFPEYEYMGNVVKNENFAYSKWNTSKSFIYKNKFTRYLCWAREFKKIAKDFCPDIIHVQGEEYGIINYLAKNKHPFLFSMMGAGLYVGVQTYFVKKWLFLKATKMANYITLDTYQMEKKLRLMAGKNLRCPVERVMWGVDCEGIDSQSADKYYIKKSIGFENNFIVLSVRNFIDSNYNITKIIDSVGEVIKKIPNGIFVFIGRDDYSNFQNYANSKGVAKYCLFKGLLIGNDYKKMIKAADIVVSVPTNDSVSTSVLESLYSGTPTVVSGHIKDLDEWIEDGKECKKVEIDKHSIADGIVEIYTNHSNYLDNCRKWAQKNREKVDYYKNLERIEEIYKVLSTPKS